MKPGEVKFVQDLPKTRNHKVIAASSRRVSGAGPGDTSSLENLQAVERESSEQCDF